MLAPQNQKPGLGLLYPCLPLWIGIDIRAVVIKQIALNLRLPGRIQKGEFIAPKIGVIELDIRIISMWRVFVVASDSRFLRKASS